MPTDYLRDNDFDILIQDGDFVKGDATQDHKASLLIGAVGDYREFPFITIDAASFVNDDDLGDLAQETQKKFELDGMVVTKLDVFEDGRIEQEASYAE